MNSRTCCATGFVVAAMTAGWAARAADPQPEPAPIISADLITRAEATRAAEAAIEACSTRGYHASVIVMDARGYMRAAFSDDGANPIGLTTSNGKAAAVLTFKASTRDLVARLQTDKQFADQYGKDARFHFSPGGLPIYKQGKFVALIAVGGARTVDEDCARAGIQTLPWASTQPTTGTTAPADGRL